VACILTQAFQAQEANFATDLVLVLGVADQVAAKLFCALPLDCASMTRRRSECGNRMGRPVRMGWVTVYTGCAWWDCASAERGECAGAATSAEFDALAANLQTGSGSLRIDSSFSVALTGTRRAADRECSVFSGSSRDRRRCHFRQTFRQADADAHTDHASKEVRS